MSEMPKIASEIQKLNPSAVIELYEVDATNHVDGGVFRFHPGTKVSGGPVVWAGNSYTPFPVEVSGFEWKSSGTLPRPTIRVANVDGLMGEVVRQMDDLIGAKVTRIRTFVKYLDAVNFPGGNPLADPTAEFARDVFFVNRKVSENAVVIEFELATMLDVHGLKVPRRVMVPNVCPWRYRGEGCGYAGPPVATELDVPTSDTNKDKCGKRLASCKLRFPERLSASVPVFPFDSSSAGVGLPFGGFPGVAIVRY